MFNLFISFAEILGQYFRNFRNKQWVQDEMDHHQPVADDYMNYFQRTYGGASMCSLLDNFKVVQIFNIT